LKTERERTANCIDRGMFITVSLYCSPFIMNLRDLEELERCAYIITILPYSFHFDFSLIDFLFVSDGPKRNEINKLERIKKKTTSELILIVSEKRIEIK
jgi:hypothetical protein